MLFKEKKQNEMNFNIYLINVILLIKFNLILINIIYFSLNNIYQ
jgi:hypothetical protein